MVGNFVFVFCHLFVSLHTVMWPLKILSSFLKAFFNIIRPIWWSTSWVYELKKQQQLWSPYSDGLLARKSVEAIKTVATCGLFLSFFFCSYCLHTRSKSSLNLAYTLKTPICFCCNIEADQNLKWERKISTWAKISRFVSWSFFCWTLDRSTIFVYTIELKSICYCYFFRYYQKHSEWPPRKKYEL